MSNKPKGMSKTMREDEAAAIRAALRGKPSPVPVKYQTFIEKHQRQRRLDLSEEDYDLRCVNGHDRCYGGPFDGCPYCERVRPRRRGKK